MSEVPATDPFEIDEPPQTKWPTVIGVISLIYACCGMLCAIGYGSWSFLSEWLMAMGNMDVTVPPIVKMTTLGSAIVAIIAGLILLIGAANLLRRRRSGPRLVMAWVVIRVLLVAAGLASLFLTARAQIDFARDVAIAQAEAQGKEPEESTDEEIWQQTLVSTGTLSAAFLIYPVFVGVWLSRRKIKDEVDRWE